MTLSAANHGLLEKGADLHGSTKDALQNEHQNELRNFQIENHITL